MSIDSLSRRLEKLPEQTDSTGVLTLSHTLSQLLYDAPLVKKIMDNCELFTDKEAAILQGECQRLGLDYDVMSKEIQQALNADFCIYDDMSPWALFLEFLEGRKLGPAGQELLQAIKLNHTLTEPQEELLEKICLKIGHLNWPEAILREISDTQGLYREAEKACSLPSKLPWEPAPSVKEEETLD